MYGSSEGRVGVSSELELILDWDAPSSLMTLVSVGTSASLKFSTLFGSNGTQMLPVLGWTQNGDFNKWFIEVDTLASNLG